MSPSWRTIPPIICTSKIRWSDSRRRASRTAANASKSRSSSGLAVLEPLPELGRLRPQLVVGELPGTRARASRCRRPARRGASCAGPRRSAGPSRTMPRADDICEQGTGRLCGPSYKARRLDLPEVAVELRRRGRRTRRRALADRSSAGARPSAARPSTLSVRSSPRDDELGSLAARAPARRRPRSGARRPPSVSARGAPPRRGTAAGASPRPRRASGVERIRPARPRRRRSVAVRQRDELDGVAASAPARRRSRPRPSGGRAETPWIPGLPALLAVPARRLCCEAAGGGVAGGRSRPSPPRRRAARAAASRRRKRPTGLDRRRSGLRRGRRGARRGGVARPRASRGSA